MSLVTVYMCDMQGCSETAEGFKDMKERGWFIQHASVNAGTIDTVYCPAHSPDRTEGRVRPAKEMPRRFLEALWDTHRDVGTGECELILEDIEYQDSFICPGCMLKEAAHTPRCPESGKK